MPQESVFRNVLGFFVKIGVYDVILPFLLVFTLMFAILEKTKVLGTDNGKPDGASKANLNAIIAFTTGFFVIASTRLVAIISEVMANVVLLVILSICFMMLVGTFWGTGEFTLQKHKGWFSFFMFAMFLGVVMIFLNALGWLTKITLWLSAHWTENATASIILIIIVIGFIVFITHEKEAEKEKTKEEE